MADERQTYEEYLIFESFSLPQDTIEAAQAVYDDIGLGLFDPAAVFRTTDGKFVMALIREQNYPPHETAKAIKKLTGMEMVATADPVLGIWKAYPPEPRKRPPVVSCQVSVSFQLSFQQIADWLDMTEQEVYGLWNEGQLQDVIENNWEIVQPVDLLNSGDFVTVEIGNRVLE